MVAIDLRGEWLDSALGDLPNRAPERRVLGCKFEVQLRR